MKELTCIVCPVGCRLVVDDAIQVSGNRCPRGEKYGISEMIAPTRMVTTTVKTTFSSCPRLSVKSKNPIPKPLVFDILNLLDSIVIDKPVQIGDVIVANILDTQIDIVATKRIEK